MQPDISTPSQAQAGFRTATFNKVFRWTHDEAGDPPAIVEIAGSFSAWERYALGYDETTATWQITLEGIPGNHTHTYMIFADGQPVADKNADGLAIPQNPREIEHQLTTARGPRVFLLYSQTK